MATVPLCDVCSNPFSDPRLLPCLHVFCKSCLESLQLESEGTLTCPSCYKTTTTPPSQLPKHLKIEREVSQAKVQEAASEAVCGTCDDSNKAVGYCEDCVSPVCTTCIDIHSLLKSTKGHKVLKSLQSCPNPSASVSSSFSCSIHPNEVLKYYCTTCKSLTCSDCMLNHKDHSCERIEEVAKDRKFEVQSVMEKMKLLHPTVLDAIKMIDSFLSRVNTNKEMVAREVDEAFDKILALVKNRRAELLRELEETALAKATQLELQKESLERLSSSVQLAVESATVACTEYSNAEALAVMGSIHLASNKLVEEIKSTNFHPVSNCTLSLESSTFTPAMEAIKSSGSILEHSHYAPLCSLLDINPSLAIGVAKGSKGVVTLQTRNRKGENLVVGGADIKGRIVEMFDKLITFECSVVDLGNGKYNIFFNPLEGKFLLDITLDGINIGNSPVVDVKDFITKDDLQYRIKTGLSPTSISIAGVSNMMFVCTNAGIEIYDNGGNNKRVISWFVLFGSKEVRGIAVDEQNGFLFVTSKDTNRVIKTTLDGKLHVLASVCACGNFCFSTPRGLCLTKDGLLLVADCNNKRVAIFGSDGFIRSMACLNKVWGVSVDCDGNVHVAATDRIEVFSIEGNKITEYGKGRLQLARDVALLKFQNEYSFVSDFKANKVFLFNWLTDTVVRSFGVPGPAGIAIDQEGRVYICSSKTAFVCTL